MDKQENAGTALRAGRLSESAITAVIRQVAIGVNPIDAIHDARIYASGPGLLEAARVVIHNNAFGTARDLSNAIHALAVLVAEAEGR